MSREDAKNHPGPPLLLVRVLPFPPSPLPPHAGVPHHLVKLGNGDAARNPGPAVGLEDHVLEQLLVDVLLEHGGHAAEVGQRDGAVAAVGEEAEGLVDAGAVRRVVFVAARVQLEGTDGKEGLVGGVAVTRRVEDGDEVGQLRRRRRRDAQRSGEASAATRRGSAGKRGCQDCAYTRADLTSSMGMTPFFSPSMGSEKRLQDSPISPSSCAETLCSLASLDCRAPPAAGALRFGG